MIGLDSEARIWLCTEPTDMRKSFRGLSALPLVRNQVKQDPLSGHYFVFVNRRKTQINMLYFTTTGYCLWARRLEQGQFRVWPSPAGQRPPSLSADVANEQQVKALYSDHATSEQFHSEFKTDLDLERLTSGKLNTNT